MPAIGRFVPLFLATFLLVASLLVGCSVSGSLAVTADGGGDGELVVDLHPMFVDYYRDLLAGFGGSADAPIFDIAAIEAGFAERDGIELRRAETDGDGTLRLSFAYDHIADVFAAPADPTVASPVAPVTPPSGPVGGGPPVAPELVRFRREGRDRVLTFALDRSVVAVALGMVAVAEMGSVGLLLPPEGSAMRPDEYADYVAWALEEYAGDADAFSVIRDSAMTIAVDVTGTVLSVTGGRRTESGARFDVSIVEMLTIEEPRTYQIRFRVPD